MTARYVEEESPLNMASLPIKGIDTKNMKLPKFESPIKKEDIDLNQQYADSLGSIGFVMGNLSGITNNSTTSWINWGAGVFQSIAQAIPSIVSLTTALTAKAAAEAAGSAASIPVVGWVAAGAAALSVVATMASIPKFANGGIVPGISFAGDKVPAMLNSGEMILNGSQQANLFKMLNSKLYGGLDVSRPNISPIPGHLAGLISPSPNTQKVEVSGNFKVRGQDLELVLDNRSRIKIKSDNMSNYGTIYTLPFKSRRNKSYIVEIQKEGYTGRVAELTGSGDAPFSIEIADDNFLYVPIRFSTATIRVVGNDYLQSLYSTGYQQYRVNFKQGDTIVWTGFITPELYTQDYTATLFDLEIQCVSAMNTLEYADYKQKSAGSKEFVSLWELLTRCVLESRGSYSAVYIPHVYAKSPADYDANANVLQSMTISEQNFSTKTINQ